VKEGIFDTLVASEGIAHAVNWALEQGATIDTDVEQHVMAWVKENR